MEDAVRASEAVNQHMLARSYRIWSSYAKEASLQSGLQPCSVKLRNVLTRVPAFLANGSPQLRLEQRGSKKSELLISGQSTWSTKAGSCDLKDKVIPLQLLLGIQRSTPCYFASDSRFANWPGLQDGKIGAIGGNYLAILAFAWAYILSARWVEMQHSDVMIVQTNDRVSYLSAEAKCIYDCVEKLPDELEVDVGDVDDDTARWWAAILATGEGWRAEITQNSTVYRSPWSICIATTQTFRIRRSGSHQNTNNGIFVPPSSEAALGYLSDFSMRHYIDSQCSVALAATLTFPFLGAKGAKLPLPNLISTSTLSMCPSLSSDECHQKKEAILEESKLLPYYMTLSCNTRGMHALLCSSFFDPQVSCNLVSPWFQSIMKIIDPLIEAGDLERVAIIMGKRHPKLAPLWMGAAISGMATTIFQWVRIGLVVIELHASVWTGTTPSFISLKSELLYANHGLEISRSDECRLLYLTEAEGHSRLPICPWKPFGNTRLCDTEIEVRQHANCMGHHLQYVSWSWNLHDGKTLEDQGFTFNGEHEDIDPDSESIGDVILWENSNREKENTASEEFCGISPTVVEIPAPNTSVTTIETSSLDLKAGGSYKDEMLSENATRSIFGWLRNAGWPQGEKEIYCHSWFDFGESDDEEEDTKSDDGAMKSANAQQAVEGWLVEQHTTGWYSCIDDDA